MKKKHEDETWKRNMKKKHEKEIWKWNMKLKHETETWNWNMKHETSRLIRSYVRQQSVSVDDKDSLWKRRWHDSHVEKGYPFS